MSGSSNPWFAHLHRPCALFDLDLSEAKKARFSVHECFTRELTAHVPSTRAPTFWPVPAMRWWKPRKAPEGRCCRRRGLYSAADLLGDAELVRYYQDGQYATLRLTSSTYHRLPCASRLPGGTGQLYLRRHPERQSQLKRVERLFCKNERAVIAGYAVGRGADAGTRGGDIGRQHAPKKFLDALLHLKYRGPTSSPAHLRRGEKWAGSSMAPPSSYSRRGLA